MLDQTPVTAFLSIYSEDNTRRGTRQDRGRMPFTRGLRGALGCKEVEGQRGFAAKTSGEWVHAVVVGRRDNDFFPWVP